MLSIMQGLNIEAFATLFSRVSLALTPLQKKDSKENRGKAIEEFRGISEKSMKDSTTEKTFGQGNPIPLLLLLRNNIKLNLGFLFIDYPRLITCLSKFLT